jgi:hypothetical protein
MRLSEDPIADRRNQQRFFEVHSPTRQPSASDQHKMGLWVGAAWQKTEPNAPMMLGGVGPGTQPYRAFTGLVVNKNAVRYGNEDNIMSFAVAAQMRQPASTIFAMIPDMPNGLRLGSPLDLTTADHPRFPSKPLSTDGRMA